MVKLRKLSASETELYLRDSVVFFSYGTPVAFFHSGKGYFRTKETYSQTTSKHINKWLRGMHYELVPQETVDSFLEGKLP